ncbi:hypothetical protein AMATHDRAFT_8789 [Amanita thiersii Skay4041]|uniref:Uncharacterized protein n=1 Tax=Amanita thiersii Skay4041 TaxID=703135 RepID=A0A2A9N924_9AGAR|nr:hypothetical protein AMATHDRAFT_8789 [Amanita thiersii Skay4041]
MAEADESPKAQTISPSVQFLKETNDRHFDYSGSSQFREGPPHILAIDLWAADKSGLRGPSFVIDSALQKRLEYMRAFNLFE